MRSSPDVLRLLALLLATGWAASRAGRLELDTENRAMRSTGSEEARAEVLREERFGRDATLVLLLAPETGKDPAAELDADAWVAGLRGLSEVRSVTELPQAGDGERLLVLTLAADPGGGFGPPLTRLLERAARTRPGTQRLLASGLPAAEAAIAESLHAEQQRIVPLVGLVLLGLLWLFYRSLALALGSILPALVGIAWTGALQEALGFAIDPVTSLLAPVLLVVGVAASVHLVEAYLEQRRLASDPEHAASGAWRHILVPGLGCVATTVIGFLALLSSPLPAVARFGILSAAGVLITAVMSFALMPPWLRLFARSPRLAVRSAGAG
ncbi:MAG: MMPL family transporter, partial [Planctomycetes bacterium]|nr:MMPL family transporter [Planctomycetota bacterium]